MTDAGAQPDSNSAYATGIADSSYEWYRTHAIGARRSYKASELGLLIFSASVPFSVAIAPHNVAATAILSAVVVVLTGLGRIFHWQENYLRFSQAREAVEAERRLYRLNEGRYADPQKRGGELASRISEIEQTEMSGWFKVIGPHRRG